MKKSEAAPPGRVEHSSFRLHPSSFDSLPAPRTLRTLRARRGGRGGRGVVAGGEERPGGGVVGALDGGRRGLGGGGSRRRRTVEFERHLDRHRQGVAELGRVPKLLELLTV